MHTWHKTVMWLECHSFYSTNAVVITFSHQETASMPSSHRDCRLPSSCQRTGRQHGSRLSLTAGTEVWRDQTQQLIWSVQNPLRRDHI